MQIIRRAYSSEYFSASAFSPAPLRTASYLRAQYGRRLHYLIHQLSQGAAARVRTH